MGRRKILRQGRGVVQDGCRQVVSQQALASLCFDDGISVQLHGEAQPARQARVKGSKLYIAPLHRQSVGAAGQVFGHGYHRHKARAVVVPVMFVIAMLRTSVVMTFMAMSVLFVLRVIILLVLLSMVVSLVLMTFMPVIMFSMIMMSMPFVFAM